jgi:hypothetical protein
VRRFVGDTEVGFVQALVRLYSLPARLVLEALYFPRFLRFSEPMDPSAIVFAAAPASVINLSPSAQAFVDNRVTSVGAWVRH